MAEAPLGEGRGLTLDGLFFRALITGFLLSCSISHFAFNIGESRFHSSFIYWDIAFVLCFAVCGVLGWLIFGGVKERGPVAWVWLPLLLLTAWCGFSGLTRAQSTDFFLASIIPYVNALLIALFVPGLIVRFRLTNFVLDGFLACSLLVSFFALIQCIMNPNDIFTNITSILTGNRSHIGLYMLIVLAVGLYRLGDAKPGWRTTATSLAFLCILVSGSRAALLGSLPLITVYFFQKISFANLVKLVFGLLAIFFIMGYIVEARKGAAIRGSDVKQSQFEVSQDVKIDASAGRRVLMWVATWKAIEKSDDVFWRGFGFTNYRWEYGKSIKLFFFSGAAHCVYLQMWSETGIIGLAFYLAFFFSLVIIGYRLRKRNRSAMLLSALSIGMLVTGVTQETFYPNEGGANLPAFFGMACIGIVVHAATRNEERSVLPQET